MLYPVRMLVLGIREPDPVWAGEGMGNSAGAEGCSIVYADAFVSARRSGPVGRAEGKGLAMAGWEKSGWV